MTFAETLVQELETARARIHELEHELAETRYQFQQVFEHIPVSAAVLDHELCYLHTNAAWLETNGLEGRNLIGQHHYEVFPFIDEERRELHRRSLAGEVVRGERDRYFRPDGSTAWMRWLIQPWYHTDQTIGGLVMYASVITPEVETGEKLLRSEARFRSLVENSPDFIMVVDRHHRIQFMNRLVPGTTLEQVIGKRAFDFVPPEYADLARAGQEAVLNGEPFARYTSPAPGPYGTWVWYETRVLPLYEDGSIAGLTLIATDITERRQIEQALHESENNSRALLRLAHQLETAATTDQVLQLVGAAIADRIGYHNTWFYVLKENGKYAELVSGFGSVFESPPGALNRLKVQGSPILEAILASDVPLIVEDARNDPRLDQKTVSIFENRTVVNIPVNRMGQRLGALGTGTFGSEGVILPTASQLEFLSTIASYVAAVIERIQFLEARRQAEAALVASETHLKEARQIARLGDFEFDLQTGTITWSEEVYGIFGLPVGTPITLSSLEQFIPSEEYTQLIATITATVNQRRSHELEHRLNLPDGTRKTVFVIGRPVFDDAGSVTKIFGIIQDITERARIQYALSDSQQFLRRVLDTIPVRIFWKDLNLNYTGGNRLFVLDTGSESIESIIGKNDLDYFQPADAEHYRTCDRRILATRIPEIGYEESQTNRDGSIRWLRTSKFPLENSAGELTGILGSYEDITGQKLAEEALRRSEERYRSLIANLPGTILIIYNHDLSFTLADDTEIRRMGLTEEWFYRTKLSELFSPEVARAARRAVAGAFHGESSSLELPYQDQVFYTTYVPIRDAFGAVEYVMAVGQNVTERKRAELATRESEERYRTLIQNLPGVAINLLDRDLHIVYADGGDLIKMGMTKADVEGNLLSELVPPEVYTGVVPIIQQAFEGKTASIEAPFRDYYFHSQYVPLRNAAGQIDQVMALNINITERRELELNLQHFMDQLRILHEITLELSTLDDLQELFFRAVELARSQLGFDRIGIFLLEEEGTVIRGTVGVDETGTIRDESSMKRPVGNDDRVMEIIRSRQRSKFWEDIDLMDRWQVIGHGWSGMVTLWDGQTGIGWIATDNLLRHEPLTPYRKELLTLYGNALGHLITRKRAEQMTREQRDFLQQIIDLMPGKVLVKDLNGRLLVINQGIVDGLGIPREAIIGKTDLELGASSETAARYNEYNQIPLQRGESTFAPEEVDDGRYYQTTRIPLKNRDGSFDRILIVAIDITARKLIEAERELLIEELAVFRALVENATNGIVMTDRNGVVIYANRAFHEMHGYDYTTREFIGNSVGGFLSTDSSDQRYHDLLLTVNQGQGMRGEARRYRKSGGMFDAAFTVFAIRNLQGEIINLGGILDDVTARKQIEAEREYLLNQSERLYHLSVLLAAIRNEDELLSVLASATALTEHGEVALYYVIYTESGEAVQIELVNEMDTRGQSLTHLGTRFDLIDFPFIPLVINSPYETILIEDTTSDPRINPAAGEILSRHGIQSVVFVPLYQSGRWIGVFMFSWTVRHRFTRYETDLFRALPGLVAPVAGNLRLVKSLEQNVEELKVATAAAQESSRLKSEFLSTMSHELRTPLNAIEGFTSIMLGNMGIDLNPQAYRMVERVSVNSKRLLSLINDFLDLSRIEAGRMELLATRLSPVKLANRWREQVAGIAEQKNLVLKLELEPTLPDILYGDEEALTKVTLNLLSNAIKFTHQGQVMLRLRVHETTWIIEVSDTGIGIPPHAREYIFDEFRQVDQSSRRQYGGTGLGLAIVQKLVRAMGGTITVQSEPDQGSTFTVTLPLQPAY